MIASMSGTQRHTEDQPALFAPTLPPRAEMERAMGAGFQEYLVKPFPVTALLRAIGRAREPLGA